MKISTGNESQPYSIYLKCFAIFKKVAHSLEPGETPSNVCSVRLLSMQIINMMHYSPDQNVFHLRGAFDDRSVHVRRAMRYALYTFSEHSSCTGCIVRLFSTKSTYGRNAVMQYSRKLHIVWNILRSRVTCTVNACSVLSSCTGHIVRLLST